MHDVFDYQRRGACDSSSTAKLTMHWLLVDVLTVLTLQEERKHKFVIREGHMRSCDGAHQISRIPGSPTPKLRKLTLRVHVPNNWVLGILVTVIIVQV